MRNILIILIILLLAFTLFLYLENQSLESELDYCCIGTWIDSQTKEGYSGPRKYFNDIPASPLTGKACY